MLFVMRMIFSWFKNHSKEFLCSGCLLFICPFVAQGEDRLVLTTSLPSHSFALNLLHGVEGFRVEKIIGDDAGPHDYQLLPSDMRRIANAQLLILIGVGFDDGLRKAFERTHGKDAPQRLINLADALRSDMISSKPEDRQTPVSNPHYWLNPELSFKCVSYLADKLCLHDPSKEDQIRLNAQNYKSQLKALDLELTQMLKPLKGKAYITQHDAFPYFAEKYGLDIVEVVEDVHDVPPGPGKLAALYKAARRYKISALCYEPGGPSKLLRQLAHDLSLDLRELDPLENGPSSATAYIQGMRANARSLIGSNP